MQMRPAIVSAIAIMALAGPSTAATHSLNADWRFMKAPKTIPLAQAKASVETKGTLKVTGEATFMPGAVIDVGNLALADGAVVLACGSVNGLGNLAVTANGRPVNYKLKFEVSQGGIVLRQRGVLIVIQ